MSRCKEMTPNGLQCCLEEGHSEFHLLDPGMVVKEANTPCTCGGQYTADTFGVVHTMPPCVDFNGLQPLEFLQLERARREGVIVSVGVPMDPAKATEVIPVPEDLCDCLCGGRLAVTVNENADANGNAVHSLFHSMPYCADFEKLDPLELLQKIRLRDCN